MHAPPLSLPTHTRCKTGTAICSAALILFGVLGELRGSALDDWQWRSPLPQPNNLSRVAYGNGTFVAVGQAGAVVTSTNAIDWKAGHSGTTSNLLDVAFGNGTFVAVGPRLVLTSPDGITWTQRDPGTPYYPSYVTFGAGKFLGAATPTNALTSVDGITWNTNATVLATEIGRPKYSDGLFVAAPKGTYGLAISSDGLIWDVQLASPLEHLTSPLAPLGQRGSVSGVAYGNGVYVAVGDLEDRSPGDDEPTFSSFSTDLLDWEAQRHLVNSLTDVTYCGSNFVVVGSAGTIMVSPPLPAYGGRAWNGVPSSVSQDLTAAAYGNGAFVVVGNAGAIASSVSVDQWGQGIWLSRSATPSSVNFRSVFYEEGLFVAAGNNGLLKTSSDGLTWTNLSAGTTRNLRDIAHGNGTLVIVGEKGAVVTSPDGGLTWTSQPVETNNPGLFAVAFGANRFVAVGDDNTNGVSVSSTDGVNWTSVVVAAPRTLQGITYAQGQFVAVGKKGAISTSPDGSIWTERSSGTSNELTGIAFGNSLFLVVGASAVLRSLDGVAWQFCTNLPRYGTFQNVSFANGRFVAVGGAGTMASSPDGISWTHHVTGNTYDLRDVTFGNGTFVVVGNNHTILQSAPEAFLSLRPQSRSGLEIQFSGAVGHSYRIQCSSNLLDWTDLHSFAASRSETNFVEDPDLPRRFYRALSP